MGYGYGLWFGLWLRHHLLIRMEGVGAESVKKILCIDPGTTHLVSCIFELDDENTSSPSIKKIWSYMFSVGHEPKKIGEAARVMTVICIRMGVRQAVIEYQAPIGHKSACRWNAYVEGGVAACLEMNGFTVETLMPSTIKRKLNLATGNYGTNKRMAFLHAKKLCETVSSHHEADCFILAEWFWKSKHLLKEEQKD